MEMNLETIASNLKNMLKVFDCHNGYDVDKKKDMDSRNYDPDFYQLPTHNTINAFLKQKNDTPKNATLQAFVSFYNKKFHTSITVQDFCETILPCTVAKSIKLPKLYEGLYYLYTKREHYPGNRTGLLYMYRDDDVYRVRALLFLIGTEYLEHPSLVRFIKDPTQGMSELQGISEQIGMEEIHNFFVGELELREDYCNIRLQRPEHYPFKTDRNEIDIFFRRISEELRPKLSSAIAILINKSFDQSLKIHKLLIGSKVLDLEDEYMNKILNNPSLSIIDTEDFSWYRYNN